MTLARPETMMLYPQTAPAPPPPCMASAAPDCRKRGTRPRKFRDTDDGVVGVPGIFFWRSARDTRMSSVRTDQFENNGFDSSVNRCLLRMSEYIQLDNAETSRYLRQLDICTSLHARAQTKQAPERYIDYNTRQS